MLGDDDTECVEAGAAGVELVSGAQDALGLGLGDIEQHRAHCRADSRLGGRQPRQRRRQIGAELVGSAVRDPDLVLDLGQGDSLLAGDRLDPASGPGG